MEKIFLVPKRGEQLNQGFEKTSSGGYKFIDLQDLLSREDSQILGRNSEVFFWGCKPYAKSKWDKINNQDWLFFYQNGSITGFSKIIHKCHNPRFAEALWGLSRSETGEEALWEYIYFFEKPNPTNISISKLAALAGYASNFVVYGFMPFKQVGVEKIISQYGSIAKFLSGDSKRGIKFDTTFYYSSLEDTSLFFDSGLINRFTASLLTKPFVILTGLSGSGKTKLAQAFVAWISASPSQYKIIPVGADWTNREPLLGYPNALRPEEYVKPDSGVLDLIIRANNQPELPHFLILDEMNLSHVERYFADFLSAMESGEAIPIHSGEVKNGVPQGLNVPFNLFIIGTVNIDETTNMFSPKVLDRANVIEFRLNSNEMEKFLGEAREIKMEAITGKGADMANDFLLKAENKSLVRNEKINNVLLKFFGELKKAGAEFGYRTASEMLRLMKQLQDLDNSLSDEQIIDIAIIQKLLPKLHGSRRKLCPVLEILGSFCINGEIKIIKDVFEKPDFEFNGPNVLYPLSLEKIARMHRGAIDNGFTSFAEA
jgi:5-methylcytosine-specific restriction protein B